MQIHNGDLAGIPPSGWLARLVCQILKADTFHWLMIIGKDNEGHISSESLGKGTSITRFVYPEAYIYRIIGLRHTPSTKKLLSIHADRGEAVYDMQVNFLITIWFLLKHYLKFAIPVIKNHTYNCQEWVCYLAACLGKQIIAEDEYPYCINLEKSMKLKFMGTYQQ